MKIYVWFWENSRRRASEVDGFVIRFCVDQVYVFDRCWKKDHKEFIMIWQWSINGNFKAFFFKDVVYSRLSFFSAWSLRRRMSWLCICRCPWAPWWAALFWVPGVFWTPSSLQVECPPRSLNPDDHFQKARLWPEEDDRAATGTNNIGSWIFFSN